MADAIPFRALALSPLQAHLNNLLCTRERPWKAGFAGRECLLDLAELPFIPACAFTIRCGDRLWKVELGNVELIRLHPALAGVDPEAVLPSELIQAILELMAEPVLAAAQQLLEVPLELEGCHAVTDRESAPVSPEGAAANFLLRIPLASTEADVFGERAISGTGSDTETGGTPWLPVPFRLVVSDRESVLMLVERLGVLPRRCFPQPDIPVAAVVEAGRMSLSIQELSGLEVGDVLLPASYPAADGHVTVSLGSSSWLCTIEGHTATVFSPLTPVSSQEMPMSEMNTESAMPEGVNVGELELPVVFELERRLLTVRDVEALAPGYTFALGGDALSPVTLTVNGRPVAKGRLVDLNGTLGVQLTEVGLSAREAGEQV